MDRLRVGLLLGGVGSIDGGTLRVHVALDDPREHVTLWSRDFQGPSTSPDLLEAQVVPRVANVAGIGVSPALRRLGRRTASSFLEASFQLADGSPQRAADLLKDVVADAPDFAPGHAQLAFAVRDAASGSAQDVQAAAITEARTHAERALVLDPRLGAPYSLLGMATPTRAWAERERWFLKGIGVDPHNVSLARRYGHLLRQVGRTQDAVAQLRQAASIELFERDAHQELALALAAAGRREEGAAILREAERVWPDAYSLKRDKLIFAMDTNSFSDALRQLDDPVFGNSVFPQEGLAATRAQIMAVESGDARRKRDAVGAVTSAASHGALPPAIAMLFLNGLGDMDGAFRQGERVADGSELQRPYAYTSLTLSPLFLPGSVAMRRDPRFMALAARFGLVDYWRSTRHWPDFCSEPGLPYNCKVEAARLAATPSPGNVRFGVELGHREAAQKRTLGHR